MRVKLLLCAWLFLISTASGSLERRQSLRHRQQTVLTNVMELSRGDPIPNGFCDPESDRHRKNNAAVYTNYLYGWQGDALKPSENLSLDGDYVKIGKLGLPDLLFRYNSDLKAAFKKNQGQELPADYLRFRFAFECVSGCSDSKIIEWCVWALFKRAPILNNQHQEAKQSTINGFSTWVTSGWTEWYLIPEFKARKKEVIATIAGELKRCGFHCKACELRQEKVSVQDLDMESDASDPESRSTSSVVSDDVETKEKIDRDSKSAIITTAAYCYTGGYAQKERQKIQDKLSPSRGRSASPAPRAKAPPTARHRSRTPPNRRFKF